MKPGLNPIITSCGSISSSRELNFSDEFLINHMSERTTIALYFIVQWNKNLYLNIFVCNNCTFLTVLKFFITCTLYMCILYIMFKFNVLWVWINYIYIKGCPSSLTVTLFLTPDCVKPFQAWKTWPMTQFCSPPRAMRLASSSSKTALVWPVWQTKDYTLP